MALTNSLTFQKNNVVSGKTLFFVIDPFCTPDSVYLNIGIWQCNIVWKCYAFNCVTLN